jgi:dephospho-CoA kinase
MGSSFPESQPRGEVDDFAAWVDRVDRGRVLIRQVIPGLAILWQEYTDRSETDSVEYADLSLKLGRFLRSVSDSPYDWWRISGLHEGNCLTLVGQALLAMDPELGFSERAQGISEAYAIIGQRASGKGTFLRFLEDLGVKCAPSSDVLRKVVRSKFITREGSISELIQEGTALKDHFGEDVLIRWTFNRLFSLYGDTLRILAVDGLRSEGELNSFKTIFRDKATIIGIDTPIDRLWENILIRQKETGRIDYTNYEEFLKTQAIEQERIIALMERPGVIRIDNSGSLDDLRIKAIELVKKH